MSKSESSPKCGIGEYDSRSGQDRAAGHAASSRLPTGEMSPLPGEVLATGTEPTGLLEGGVQDKDTPAFAGSGEPEAAKGIKVTLVADLTREHFGVILLEGSRRCYAPPHIAQIMVIKKLRRAGYSLQKSRIILKHFRRIPKDIQCAVVQGMAVSFHSSKESAFECMEMADLPNIFIGLRDLAVADLTQ